MSHHRKLASVITTALVAAAFVPVFASAPAWAEAHMDNPYVGATQYVNPTWKANIDTTAAGTSNSALSAKIRAIDSTPTAVWMDRRAAISGADGGAGLVGHFNAALAQKTSAPETVTFVIYDLPGRDCNALASNGELPATAAGLATYKAEYIDVIAATFADPRYANLRIITIIEPDSLPNLVTNPSVPACEAAAPFYEQGVAYALDKLHAIPNVYTYVDAAHAGWLGWPNNSSGTTTEFAKVANMTAAGKASIDGFITDTANYTPLVEPFFTGSTTVGGQQVMSDGFYEFNPDIDEVTFAADMYNHLVAGGFPASIGMLIDTSRNGWGGPARPTAASTSTDLATFVSQSKVDRRTHRGAWCNQSGAGLGELPRATPGGFPNAHLDAFVWVKPPGESDGASTQIPNDEGKGFDRMCDPTFSAPALKGALTGALPDAPLSGQWFAAQVRELVANAFPVIGGEGGDTTAPSAPAALASPAKTSSSVSLTWAASTDNVGVTGYQVFRGTTLVGSPTTTSFTDTGLAASTAFTYTVQARDAAGNTSAASAALTVTTNAATGGGTIKVQYKNNDSAPADNQIKPGLQIVNTGADALNLITVTARYYFTREAGASTFSTYCDYAQLGCSNITSRVVLLPTPVAGADAYLEVSFTGGTIAAGGTSGDIQLRFNKTDWSNFNEVGDYSRGTGTSFTDSSTVTGFAGTTLVWGTPPT